MESLDMILRFDCRRGAMAVTGEVLGVAGAIAAIVTSERSARTGGDTKGDLKVWVCQVIMCIHPM